MNLKLLIWSVSIVFLKTIETTYAQTNIMTSSSFASHVNNVIPPSPNAASLGTFGNYPIKGFDGVPTINIPLLNLNLKSFSLPISLSYNANGIKVGEIGSWVGLGWSLNFGGVITRSVVDEADDLSNGIGPGGLALGRLNYNYDMPGYSPVTENQIVCSGQGAPGALTGALGFDYAGLNWSWMAYSVANIKQNHMDMEPDIFYYNFNSRAGKFVFNAGNSDSNRKILLTPYQDLKMEYSMGNDSYGTYNFRDLASFTVTDESGNKYYFQTKEHTLANYADIPFCFGQNNHTCPGRSDWARYFVSSWYITKIVTALNETINFTYADEIFSYDNIPNVSVKDSPAADPAQNIDDQGRNLTLNSFGDYEMSGNSYTIYGKRLTSIEGDNFKVEFIAGINRQDIVNSFALTAIKYYSKVAGSLALLKEFDLNYHYMSDLSKPQILGMGLFGSGAGDSRKRLLLDSIQNKESGSRNISSYSFNYYGEEVGSPLPLPDRLSHQTDFWGYFNNNQAMSSIPKLYCYNGLDQTALQLPIPADYILPGANKNTNPIAILSGTLKSIKFPTLGTTNFVFEPHVFNYSDINFVGGGLRLKKTIAFDGLDHSHDLVKSYEYNDSQDITKTSGVLFNLPIFSHVEQFPYKPGPVVDVPTAYRYNVVRSDLQSSSLGAFDGITVGYREITEINADNSRILRRYSVPGAFTDVSDIPPTQLDEDDNPMGSCNITYSGFCDGYFKQPTRKVLEAFETVFTSCPVTLKGYSYNDNSLTNYPYAPNTNYDWNRGLLLDEKIFDNSNNLKKSIAYNYAIYTPNNSGPQFVNGIRYATLQCDNFNYTAHPDAHAQVISQYNLITQVAKVLSSEIVSDYDALGNVLSSTKTYTYNHNSLNPSTEQDDRSDGTSTIAIHKYVSDFDFSQTSTLTDYLGYQNLQNNHINALVEDYVQKKNTDNSLTTIGATQVTYKPNLPLPSMSYIIRSTTPLTSFSPISVSTTAISKDSHYEPEQSMDLYDAKDNIAQITSKQIAVKSFIWGYNWQFPMAVVENASRSDVAFSNFENSYLSADNADELGGWQSDNFFAVIADNTAPTGQSAFRLNNNNTALPLYKSGLDVSKTYLLSCWVKSGGTVTITPAPINTTTLKVKNGWTLNQYTASGTSTITVSSTTNGTLIDDLRLCPKDAEMTTYTYLPMYGITSTTDAKGNSTYYEYDSYQRLLNIKDQHGNIIKSYCYNFANTSYGCPVNPITGP